MEARNYSPEEKPIIVPTREHTSLEIFVGKWAIEGKGFAYDSNTKATKIKGIATYEWLPGGFFLCYKWDRFFDFENNSGLGIISHDENNHSFSITNYDNQGNSRTYQIIHVKNTWKFTGEKERATIKFNPNADAFSESWEILTNNENWLALCEIKGHKIE